MSSTTVLDSGGRRGFLHHLFGLYASPGKEFTAILPKARWWRPLALLIVLQVGFTAVWLNKIDTVEFAKAEVERSGRMERIPADQRAQVFETQARFFPIIGWTGAVIGAPILVLLVGGVYLVVFRFFLGSEVTFKRVLAIVAWSFVVVSLVTTPLVLVTLYLKGDWTVNPRMALSANLAMPLDSETASKPLYALLDSFDLFSFWILLLLYTGFRIATPFKPGTVAAAVLAPWGIYVVGKMLVATFF